MVCDTGSRHRAHSPATGAVAVAVTSTPSVTDSNRTLRSNSASCGIQAMPVWRSAGAGTARVSARVEPGRRSSARVSKTNSPRGSVRAPAVLRNVGMANSGSERFWSFILPARRPESESIAAPPHRTAAPHGPRRPHRPRPPRFPVSRCPVAPGQPGPGEPSLTRSCASTAGGTSAATLPPYAAISRTRLDRRNE